MTEYMEKIEAVKEAIWLKGLVVELNSVQLESILRCDSQSEAHLLMFSRMNLLSLAIEDPIFVPMQDMLIGIISLPPSI